MKFGNLANGSVIGQGGMRQSAKNVIEDKIAQLRREADRLEALKNALPDLDGPADEALWSLLWK